MRCLFITNYPLSPHLSGGSAIGYEQFCSIYELGHEIHLWKFGSPGEMKDFEDYQLDDANIWSDYLTQ